MRSPQARALTRRRLLAEAGAAAAAAAALPAWSRAAARRRDRTAAELRRLAALVRGPVVTASDPQGLAIGAQLYNSRFDGAPPRAVVYALNERDVQATVRWAARTGTRIAARSGGHSYGGYSRPRGGVVLDVTGIRGTRARPRDRRAAIGAGSELSEVYTALADVGQTIPAGTCPTVGIAGLALGGGVGFVGRRWGTTSDNVLALRIVTADGRARTVDERRDEDLYWACRGGGGNFGVVTAFLMRTFPTDPASTFVLTYDWSQIVDVVQAWQAWAPEAPDDLFSICSIQTGTTTPSLRISGQLFGAQSAIPAAIAPLTSAVAPVSMTSGTKNYAEAISFWAQCTQYAAAQCARQEENPDGDVPRRNFWGKSQYVDRPMPSAAGAVIRDFIDRRQADSALGLGEILLDSYGGALNRPAPGATAFVHRDNLFSMQYVVYWDDPSGEDASVAWIRAFHRAMAPYASGLAYQNYIDPDLETWRAAYYGRNYPRLLDVKRRYDPDHVFRFAQGVGAPRDGSGPQSKAA
jgi:FAD/FMN-containing dehydrogenase